MEPDGRVIVNDVLKTLWKVMNLDLVAKPYDISDRIASLRDTRTRDLPYRKES
jgi:hypothetical protein